MRPSDTVDKAIDRLADAFCKIGQGAEHKRLYVEAMQSVARMQRSETLLEITTDMNHARLAMVYGPTK